MSPLGYYCSSQWCISELGTFPMRFSLLVGHGTASTIHIRSAFNKRVSLPHGQVVQEYEFDHWLKRSRKSSQRFKIRFTFNYRPSANWGSELFRVVTIILPGYRRPKRWLPHIGTEGKPLHISSQRKTRFRTLDCRGQQCNTPASRVMERELDGTFILTDTGWFWSLSKMDTRYCTGLCLGSK